MRADQMFWSERAGWQVAGADRGGADLILYFGGRKALEDGSRYRDLRAMFPEAHIVGCSTGGQIRADDVSDDGIAAVAMSFKATGLRVVSEAATSASRACGAALGTGLMADDLAGVLVLSDGLNVNGSELVAGITGVIGRAIPLTGGLAGDGAEFGETLVGGDGPPKPRNVVAIGFYGAAVKIGHGSAGGWDVFGPRRRVTRSQGNVLFELDGEPALDLYERYLGDEAKGMPGTALLFPLRIHDPEQPSHDIVRTVLAIDRDARSMTFAGDVPEKWVAQLMRGNFDRLAGGAGEAARQARVGMSGAAEAGSVALLVSCIGRRLLMGQRVTEELEATASALGPEIAQLGFYSYGEISPHAVSGLCELHNQTMTVTLIGETVG